MTTREALPLRSRWLPVAVVGFLLIVGTVILIVMNRSHQAESTAFATPDALLRQAQIAVAELENQSLTSAIPKLERLSRDLPTDPFGPRNLAVAGLLAAIQAPPDAVAVRTITAHLEEALRRGDDDDVIERLAAMLAVAAADDKAAAARWLGIVHRHPSDAVAWYGLWRTGRQRDGGPVADPEPLARALETLPSNVWLTVEWLRSTAALLDVTKSTESDATRDELAAASMARWPAIAPYAPSIIAFTKADPRGLLDQASNAIRSGNCTVAAVRLRALANLLAPQSEADRRIVEPHPLEFVRSTFTRATLNHLGLSSPAIPPAVPIRFVAGEAPDAQATAVGAPLAVILEDIDLDGTLDMVVAHDETVRVWSFRDGGWSLLCAAAVPAGTVGILVADLDLDFDETRRVRAVVPAAAGPARPCPAADLDIVVYGAAGITCLQNVAEKEGTRLLRRFDHDVTTAGGVTAATSADVDADGLLDLVIADTVGTRILVGLGSGGFREAEPILPASRVSGVCGLVPVDFDRDVDVDVILVGEATESQSFPVIGWLENLRHGQFRFVPLPVAGEDGIAIDILDADADAAWDILVGGSGGISRLASRRSPTGVMRFESAVAIDAEPCSGLATFDYDNDGMLDAVAWGDAGARLFRGTGDGRLLPANVPLTIGGGVRGLDVGDLDGDGDLDLVIITADRVIVLVNEGGNAHHWLAIDLEAQQVKGAGFAPSGRVNAHGLGSLLELHAGNTYQPRTVRRRTTHFGLGDRPAADVVRVLWLNGVPQNIIAPPADVIVCEQQLLLGSCPYLYTWDGTRYVFVTDLLWAAPLGLQRRERESMPWRAWEHLAVSGTSLVPRDGEYVLQITEELWEAAYFDEVRLTAVDHPADVEVFSNEKVGPPEIAAFGIHTVRHRRAPETAHDHLGNDVLDLLRSEDGRYVSADTRVRQGLTEPHAIELDPGPLTAAAARRITLFLNGWTYPTTVGLNLALDRDPSLDVPAPPTLSVPDGSGGWRVVMPFMGFPGGKTKTIAIDISGLLVPDDPRVRIETTMDIRWDAAFFAIDEPPAEVRLHDLPLHAADLHRRGFSRVDRDDSDGPERFDYDDVSTAERWPPMFGRFTRFGDVQELVMTADDRLVVMAAGDEMTLRFDAGPPCPPGWHRDFLISNVGWDKDANLATIEGQSVEPLPFRAMQAYPPAPDSDERAEDTSAVAAAVDRYQTRQQGNGFWRPVPQRANATLKQ
ncbi:MAG: CRTAC1 family protein [Planctomycetota bacterium]|nr:CRTAC1 family protein [Planctomycetota bacterium]